MRYDHYSELPVRAFSVVCGRMTYEGGGGKGDSAPAPDYQPMATASTEVAQIGAQLGREQLAENTRQYEKNMAVAQPIVDAQAALMKQSTAQGDDYYKYMLSKQRPVEDALNAEAMTGQADAATQTAMREASDKAIADARNGSTQQVNMIARQGLRYGFSPAKMAALSGTAAVNNASTQAAAANAASTQARAQGWAKRLDVAGLYRNLPGASQGAYTLANQSGNSAVGNQNQTAAQYLNGMNAGTGTIMQGQQAKMTGLGSILNSQTSSYNASLANQESSPWGSLIGAAGGIGAAFISDRRLKENIVCVGTDEKTGLNLYEFNYISEPNYRFVGVMADEVEKEIPDAVIYDSKGFASVDYGMLGIEMKEVA